MLGASSIGRFFIKCMSRIWRPARIESELQTVGRPNGHMIHVWICSQSRPHVPIEIVYPEILRGTGDRLREGNELTVGRKPNEWCIERGSYPADCFPRTIHPQPLPAGCRLGNVTLINERPFTRCVEGAARYVLGNGHRSVGDLQFIYVKRLRH